GDPAGGAARPCRGGAANPPPFRGTAEGAPGAGDPFAGAPLSDAGNSAGAGPGTTAPGLAGGVRRAGQALRRPAGRRARAACLQGGPRRLGAVARARGGDRQLQCRASGRDRGAHRRAEAEDRGAASDARPGVPRRGPAGGARAHGPSGILLSPLRRSAVARGLAPIGCGGPVTEERMERYLFKLYVAGQTPRSERAIVNLRRICDSMLSSQYELHVIDVLERPNLAEQEGILAT